MRAAFFWISAVFIGTFSGAALADVTLNGIQSPISYDIQNNDVSLTPTKLFSYIEYLDKRVNDPLAGAHARIDFVTKRLDGAAARDQLHQEQIANLQGKAQIAYDDIKDLRLRLQETQSKLQETRNQVANCIQILRKSK